MREAIILVSLKLVFQSNGYYFSFLQQLFPKKHYFWRTKK